MKVKMILPALVEAKSPFWRPIKYSLFPPLGLATLASFLSPADEVEIVDEHVEEVAVDDTPDLVVIQVYVTSASRAYRLADHYRAKGVFVALGGLHVTSVPEEAALHADAIFLGPGDTTFPQFLADFRRREAKPVYFSPLRSLDIPLPRRDLIKRERYLVPNSLVVSRGCPHHCNFCYKDNFFQGGPSFYTRRVDAALAEIESLPGRHLYFLDDHLLGDRKFSAGLFEGMRGMKRLFQGAATVDSILEGDLIEKAVEAGLRSIFIGFESINPANLRSSNKRQNLGRDYDRVIRRLDELGVFINGSFVFGLDDDGPDVFRRTASWAIERGITTATFHILTPYPGTGLFQSLNDQGRITSRDWDLYDTRHVVYQPKGMSAQELKDGYDWAYREFYSWGSILEGAGSHLEFANRLRHVLYAGGWKRFEPLWNFLIKSKALFSMRGVLESILSSAQSARGEADSQDGKLSLDNRMSIGGVKSSL
ncbi:B12-binding domain-containing radical SAM protein [Geomonas sp. Red32]|uniref:B12-binding domain-containing radical SAM protein n=1 Tax=Geomonas sp. Red32 TaxID=2912856 RepID=UPI00202CE2F5|nr:radical SAM protein [Geomonas sp. Red32]MCM0083832.1 B12-binding domain-containing radical SAM protein [Geomonas sp. Red32]